MGILTKNPASVSCYSHKAIYNIFPFCVVILHFHQLIGVILEDGYDDSWKICSTSYMYCYFLIGRRARYSG